VVASCVYARACIVSRRHDSVKVTAGYQRHEVRECLADNAAAGSFLFAEISPTWHVTARRGNTCVTCSAATVSPDISPMLCETSARESWPNAQQPSAAQPSPIRTLSRQPAATVRSVPRAERHRRLLMPPAGRPTYRILRDAD
jgi:hypothetical protein